MKVQSICTEMTAEYLRMAALYVYCGNQLITILNCVLIYEVCSQYISVEMKALIFLKVRRFLGFL